MKHLFLILVALASAPLSAQAAAPYQDKGSAWEFGPRNALVHAIEETKEFRSAQNCGQPQLDEIEDAADDTAMLEIVDVRCVKGKAVFVIDASAIFHPGYAEMGDTTVKILR